MNTLLSTYSATGRSIQAPARTLSGLRWFSKLLCFSVLVLLFLGANVKSHEAGLAVPDWPTSFGYNMFTFPISFWVGGIFHEHVHRLVASGVGFLTVVLTAWTLLVDHRRWVKLLTAGSLFVVVLQGVLGGLTVLYQLPAWISSAHGTLAQIFLCITIVIAYSHSLEFSASKGMELNSRLGRLLLILFLSIFFQLILGAFVRHTESALAVPDFPLMAGNVMPSWSTETVQQINSIRYGFGLPAVGYTQVILHLAHRFWGVFILCLSAWVMTKGWSASKIIRNTILPVFLITLLQVALGASVVLTGRHPYIASVHLLAGAILLGGTLLALLRAMRQPS